MRVRRGDFADPAALADVAAVLSEVTGRPVRRVVVDDDAFVAGLVADFWAELPGWELADEHDDGVALLPTDRTGFRLRFPPNREPKAAVTASGFRRWRVRRRPPRPC